MDQFDAADKLARSISDALNEDFDQLDFDRQAAYRRVGNVIQETLMSERDKAVSLAADGLTEMIGQPSTPKRWHPGLQEGARALRTLVKQSQLDREIKVPNELVTIFEKPDPYADAVGGDPDPYAPQRPFEPCGAWAEGEWTCTRPKHPSHWQHFDADPAFGDGSILVTWDDSGELTSIHPEIFEQEDDY